MTSHNINTSLIIKRGRLAVHLAQLYALGQVIGFSDFCVEMSTGLIGLLEEENQPNFYQQGIDERLLHLIQAVPEFAAVLAQPDGLKQGAGLLCKMAEEVVSSRFSESDLEQSRSAFAQIKTKLQESLEGVQGDGLSALGDDLDVDLKTIVNEPKRLRAIFPPRGIGLGAGEINKLESALGFSVDKGKGEHGADQYVQVLFPTLLQVAHGSGELRARSSPANSPVWKWAGVDKPNKKHPLLPDEAVDAAATAVANLLSRMASQKNRQQVARYILARLLRQEYGLGTGRGHEASPFSELEGRWAAEVGANEAGNTPHWDFPDPQSGQNYEDVETSLMLADIRDSAPPAQREAMELYLESLESGAPLADVCRERGKDPKLVRNNFQALKRSAKIRRNPE